MPISLSFEGESICRADATGLLRQTEWREAEAGLIRQLERTPTLRLFVVLHDFEGWFDGDDWRDLGFYATHGDRIARIAIVGPERWRSEALLFAAAGLRKAPVEYFLPAEFARARAWLQQS